MYQQKHQNQNPTNNNIFQKKEDHRRMLNFTTKEDNRYISNLNLNANYYTPLFEYLFIDNKICQIKSIDNFAKSVPCKTQRK